MRARTVPSVAAILAGAAALGAALAVLKGTGYDLWYFVGNASAPYVIVAVLAGMVTRRPVAAAALGVAATWLVLATFYWTASTVYLGRLTPDEYLPWFAIGAVSGALSGLAGMLTAGRPTLRYLVPALLILEPAVLRIVSVFGYGVTDVPVFGVEAYALEVAVGVLLAALVRRRLIRRRSAAR